MVIRPARGLGSGHGSASAGRAARSVIIGAFPSRIRAVLIYVQFCSTVLRQRSWLTVRRAIEFPTEQRWARKSFFSASAANFDKKTCAHASCSVTVALLSQRQE